MDTLQKKLYDTIQAHRSKQDATEIDEIFHSYSHEISAPIGDDSQDKDKESDESAAQASDRDISQEAAY